MQTPAKRLQPRAYHAFRCLGAECEDTCCSGWLVNVDKNTYDTYQHVEDPVLAPRLREFVIINPAATSDESFARFALSGTGCHFVEDGLCGIQSAMGEPYLSMVCSRYPRFMNVVDDVLERSLDMACPEAVRLMLLDPEPLQFDDAEGVVHDPRLGAPPALTVDDPASRKPYPYFHQIRAFVIELLQYRAYPLSKRLVILASFCDQLEQLAEAGQNEQVSAAIDWFRGAVRGNALDQAIASHMPKPVTQLSVLLELMVARITGEYVSPRFLDCYREFKDGIAWAPDSSMEEIGARYAAAYAQQLTPFLEQHEHMLEHYLVNYVYRTLFPLGAQHANRDAGPHRVDRSMRDQCLVMLMYYGVIQTVLVGMAAFHGAEFGPGHVVRAVQSVTKAFEHNLSFPAQALQILTGNGIRSCVSLAILLRN